MRVEAAFYIRLAALNTVLPDLNGRIRQITEALEAEVIPFPGSGMSLGDIDRRLAELEVQFQKLLEKAGIEEHVRFHDLRHTFSTLAIQSGIDPKTVAEILGHASAEFSLDVYTHVTAGMKKEAAQKISGFMAGVG